NTRVQRRPYLSPNTVTMNDVRRNGGTWLDFQRNPLPGVHGDYLAQCLLPVGVQDEAAWRQVIENDRTRDTFLLLLRRTFGLQPLSGLQPVQSAARMVALDVQGWFAAAEACGLMFLSPALVRELRGPIVQGLAQQLGPTWWDWVKRGIDTEEGGLCPTLIDPWPDTAQSWATRIHRTGFALLDAWTTSLDKDLAAWARLKSPVEPADQDSRSEVDRTVAMAVVESMSQQLQKAS